MRVWGDSPELEMFRTKGNAMMYNPADPTIFTFDQPTKNSRTAIPASATPAYPRATCAARNGARFIQISFGSWVSSRQHLHADTNLQSMSKQFDAGVWSAYSGFEKRRHVVEYRAIVAFGEFGRTVGALNQNAGRCSNRRCSPSVLKRPLHRRDQRGGRRRQRSPVGRGAIHLGGGHRGDHLLGAGNRLDQGDPRSEPG